MIYYNETFILNLVFRRHTATQMESYHLRQVFPCFDEPHLKASFNVTIIRRDNYTTLGNEAITELGPE